MNYAGVVYSTASVDNSVDEWLGAYKIADTQGPNSSLPKMWALWSSQRSPYILWLDGSIFSFFPICGLSVLRP
jgi:hypothetical protein